MIFDLNIFTCCNEKYVDFVPLFIISNLFHNDCHVEIGIDNNCEIDLSESLNILEILYPNQFLIRSVEFNKGYCPNIVRFLIEPIIKSKFVYISDIDIITLDSDIIDRHTSIMKDNNLPYSNIIRPNSNRLSGLHFTPYENYYPINDWDDLKNYVQHDEVFLYHLLAKRFPNLKNECNIRPVHGIHVSPNRKPISDKEISWNMHLSWRDKWYAFRQSKEFLILYDTFSERVKNILSIIDNRYSN